MYSWFQNLINLKNIFDKYLPMVREVYSWFTVHKDELADLHKQINELRHTLELLRSGGSKVVLDSSVEEASIENIEAEDTDKIEVEAVTEEVTEEPKE